MEQEDWKRLACFGCLQFLGLDKTIELFSAWRDVVSNYTLDISKQIEFDLDNYLNDDLPRSGIMAQLSVLAILISKEFDAALEAIVTGEWGSFDTLFEEDKKKWKPMGKDWHDFRKNEVFLWCRQLAEWVETADEGAALPPVREIEPWEKRLWCEEIARSLPRTAAPFEQEKDNESLMDSERLHRRQRVANRLHLSIDPFTPVETVTKKVAEIVKRYQEKRTTEYMEDFQHEINQGALEPDIVQQEANEDRLSYDTHRTTQGKQHKTIKGNFEIYLRSLRVYSLDRGGCTPGEIASRTHHPQGWEGYQKRGEDRQISSAHKKDKDRAQKLGSSGKRVPGPEGSGRKVT